MMVLWTVLYRSTADAWKACSPLNLTRAFPPAADGGLLPLPDGTLFNGEPVDKSSALSQPLAKKSGCRCTCLVSLFTRSTQIYAVNLGCVLGVILVSLYSKLTCSLLALRSCRRHARDSWSKEKVFCTIGDEGMFGDNTGENHHPALLQDSEIIHRVAKRQAGKIMKTENYWLWGIPFLGTRETWAQSIFKFLQTSQAWLKLK